MAVASSSSDPPWRAGSRKDRADGLRLLGELRWVAADRFVLAVQAGLAGRDVGAVGPATRGTIGLGF